MAVVIDFNERLQQKKSIEDINIVYDEYNKAIKGMEYGQLKELNEAINNHDYEEYFRVMMEFDSDQNRMSMLRKYS